MIHKYLRHIAIPLFIVLVIFTGTCLWNGSGAPNMPDGIPWDKVAHFGMFFVLSAMSLLFYDRLHNGKPKMWRWLFWGFVMPVLYGGVIELLQKNVFTSRSAEWGDFVANTLGSLLACFVVIIGLKYIRKQKKWQS